MHNNTFIDDIPVALLAVAGVQHITGLLNPILMSIFYLSSIVWLVVQIKSKLKKDKEESE
jgi:hypothetical protein